MDSVQIIILAAGKGTRMESDKPKALTLLTEKPFLGHILETTEELNLTHKPLIVVGYKKEDIHEFLCDKYTCVEQTEQLGTGHAVLQAKSAVEEGIATIIVLYADHPLVSKETIVRLIETQRETGAKVVVAPTEIENFEDWRKTFLKWGRFKRNENGELVGIVEYKDASDDEKNITEVNPGYFAFDASWMWKHLEGLKNNNGGGEYYLTELLNIAFSENQKIASVSIPPEEAVGANSLEELAILERIHQDKIKNKS